MGHHHKENQSDISAGDPPPPYLRSLRLRGMANGLHIVAVRIQDEGAVVVGVIDFANAWRTIVLAASRNGRLVEGAHLRTGFRGESDVYRRLPSTLHPNPELRLRAPAQARPAFDFHHQPDAKRRKRPRVEGLAAIIVRNADTDVINDHEEAFGLR